MVVSSLDAEPDVVLYADGGTKNGSPGTGIYWSVGQPGQGITHGEDDSGTLRRSDEAEYVALLWALRILHYRSKPGDQVQILMDCLPVVRNIQTQHKPKNPRLRGLYWDVMEELEKLQDRDVRVSLSWVPRREVVKVLGH